MADPQIEVFHGDAHDFVRFASRCHLALFDPPYSAHVHTNAMSNNGVEDIEAGRAKKGVVRRDLGFSHLTPELACALADFMAGVQRWSLVYSDVESLHKWRETVVECGAEYIRTIPWVRWSQPQLSGDRPPTGWEALSVFHRAERGRGGRIKPVRKHWNGYGELTHLAHEDPGAVPLDHPSMRGAGKHKAQKPLWQALDLVSWFSDPGEIVADLVMGRGTTMRAAQILGRKGLGVELDRAEFRKARARLRGPLDDNERVQVARFIERVGSEKPVSEKFPPALARQRRRIADAERAKEWL